MNEFTFGPFDKFIRNDYLVELKFINVNGPGVNYLLIEQTLIWHSCQLIDRLRSFPTKWYGNRALVVSTCMHDTNSIDASHLEGVRK